VVYPEVKNKATAVIVIHEIFGMSDWVQSLTDQLAEAGYIAIAPDLLSGMGPNGGGTSSLGGGNAVGQAIRDLPPDQITADLNAVADYVSKLPAANGKIVVAGFCWGGGQTFRFATNTRRSKPPTFSTVPHLQLRKVRTKRHWRRSRRRSTVSTPATTLASTPHFRRPPRQWPN
jgi:dienelactone hydrolase